MAVDWDALVLGPLERIFGEGGQDDQPPQPIMFQPASGGAPYPIDGVFDAAWRDLELVDPLGVTTTQPVLGVRMSTWTALGKAGPQQDDQLTIPRTGLTYIVREVRPDSHGGAKLILGEMQ